MQLKGHSWGRLRRHLRIILWGQSSQRGCNSFFLTLNSCFMHELAAPDLVDHHVCLSPCLSSLCQASNPIDVAARPGAVPHTLLQKDPRVRSRTVTPQPVSLLLCSFWWKTTLLYVPERSRCMSFCWCLFKWRHVFKSSRDIFTDWLFVFVADNKDYPFVHADNRSIQDVCQGKWTRHPFLLSASSLWPGHKV